MTEDDGAAIRAELAALDGAFSCIRTEEDPGPVPDGRWQGRITSATLKRATSARPMIEWEITVTTEGPQAERVVVVRWVITEKTLKWIKEALLTVGLAVPKISTVADHLPTVTGALIDFTIRTKGESRNVYFNRRLDGGGGGGRGGDRGRTVIEDFPV